MQSFNFFQTNYKEYKCMHKEGGGGFKTFKVYFKPDIGWIKSLIFSPKVCNF